MTLIISAEQVDTLEAEKKTAWLLQVVSEWFPIYSACYEPPVRVDFDRALAVADHVLQRLALYPEPSSGPVGYPLVHAVLSAGERGAGSQQLHDGLNAFFNALPAAEAGFILFESHYALA
jgi:hypothetical protein